MKCPNVCRCWRIALAGWFCMFGWNLAAQGEPALRGYANYEQLTRRVQELAQADLVTASSLGETATGRSLHLLTLAAGGAKAADQRPAVLIVGDVAGGRVIGSELALRIVAQLVQQAEKDPAVKSLLKTTTFYVIPRPSPDAAERCFTEPGRVRVGNSRATDDDRDGERGEDPPDDLNGDGVITQMRVRDASGEWFPHPDDPRVMIQADPLKNERGQYRLLTEGRDDDQDESFNEDGSDGVELNRNFPFNYPYFKPAAGEHAASEPETRAIADFCYDHANIAVVFTFTPEDNLLNSWKPSQDKGRIKTGLSGKDAPYYNLIAERYRDTLKQKGAPASPSGEGSFSEWAYLHYGRWSLAARAWWPPEAKPAKGANGEEEEKKESGEKRGADQIKLLRWLEQRERSAVIPWQGVEHPDFPGKTVEVGGVKPYYAEHPPARELDSLAEKHRQFLAGLPELFPRLSIHQSEATSLGGNLWRLEVTVLNDGYLPTMSDLGRVSEQVHAVQAAVELPAGSRLLKGSSRTQLGTIRGAGGTEKVQWLFQLPAGSSVKELPLRIWAPSIGEVKTVVPLKD